jgi:tetratricopeptide (TPR) repeat protein
LVLGLLAVLLPLATIAQITDFKGITFRSDFEKMAFQDFVERPQDPDIFTLMMAPDWNMNKNLFQHHLAQFDSLIKDYRGMPLSQLNDATKRDLLKTYILYSTFSDIFQEGVYNCVSGTALVALYLQHFDIPFQVIWKPGHVYIRAQKGQKSFAFESTSLINGLANTDALHTEILTTKFSIGRDSAVSIMALPAFQYQNEAIWAAQAGQYKLALNCLRKASMLYPSIEIESSKAVFLYNYLSSKLQGLNSKDLDDYKEMVTLFSLYYEDLQFVQMIQIVRSRFPKRLQRQLERQ